MLQITGTLERKKLSKNISSTVFYAIQIDGNTDHINKDNKFVTARYIAKDYSTEIVTIFLGVVSPNDYRTIGLLIVTTCILGQSSISTDNLVGVTTDGEADNTEKNSGLWKFYKII